MKTVEQYKCEVCGGVYDTENEALACERKHAKIVRIDTSFSPNHVAPDSIKIVLEGYDISESQLCEVCRPKMKELIEEVISKIDITVQIQEPLRMIKKELLAQGED